MKFERKHYIYILIALVLSLTAIAQEQTISSELANFTEINTSRIFRVYDASTSEILLSSDALYLNHVNGGINEVKITATDTQFMHDIDMAGNNINNCGNCGGSDNLSWQNSKVNKSGDNMTGKLNISLNFENDNNSDYENNFIIKTYNNNSIKTITHSGGIQNWFLGYSGGKLGKIGYSTPGGKPGIYLGNTSCMNYGDPTNVSCAITMMKRRADNGLQLSAANDMTSSGGIIIDVTSNLTILGAAGGSNYEFACFDSNGKLIRSSISCDLI